MKRRLMIFLLALLLQGGLPAGADQALVVGVESYPGLKGQDARLLGCVNDARLMAERLRSLGFEVRLLTEQQATRDAILRELERMRGQRQERFVFYFAGHGTGGDEPYLLPYDSKEGTLAFDLSGEALNRAVAAIPATHRSVVLDSCFSEMFFRSRAVGPMLRSRYYRKTARSKGVGPQDASANAQDALRFLDYGPPRLAPSTEGTCYLVAARQSEAAQEAEFDDKNYGVFTYYLASRLLSNRPLWGDLQMEVSALVAERVGDLQHPTLTPGYAPVPVFGGPPAEVSPQQSASLWEIFNRDRVDRSQLRLEMSPDRSTVRVGDPLTFSVEVGRPGYLLVLEHGVSGKVNLLFPSSRERAAGGVRQGEVIEIPAPRMAFTPDAPGVERVRALLFDSREEAEPLLAVLDETDNSFGSFVRRLKARDLKLVSRESQVGAGPGLPVHTSDVFFQVLP
ncbi:MAG: caspase family protein [Armatimonadetes bacterium]|nr:caspase family protein [Armatimonadota bacterium]